MTIPLVKLSKIKAAWESGKLTRLEIGKKYGVSRMGLYELSKKHEWEYGKNVHNMTEEIEKKTIDKIVNKEVDKTVKIKTQFLQDIDVYRRLCMKTAEQIVQAYTEASKTGKEIPKDEYDRIFAGSKISKINLEALNICYAGAMRAMGIDQNIKIDTDVMHRGSVKLDITNLTDDQILELDQIADEAEYGSKADLH